MHKEIIIGIFTLFGVIIGLVGNIIIFRFDRKDKYFFALLAKRFEVNSQAYDNVEKLTKILHSQDKDRNPILSEIRQWYNENNLYLKPEIRERFSNNINNVQNYPGTLEDCKNTGRNEGWDSKKAKEKEDELNRKFKDIMFGIQKSIQEDMDKYYYKYIK